VQKSIRCAGPVDTAFIKNKKQNKKNCMHVYYWCYFSEEHWLGGAFSQRFLASGTAPVSIRGFQVLLTAISHGQLVRTSLFWLYLAVGVDFSTNDRGSLQTGCNKKGSSVKTVLLLWDP